MNIPKTLTIEDIILLYDFEEIAPLVIPDEPQSMVQSLIQLQIAYNRKIFLTEMQERMEEKTATDLLDDFNRFYSKYGQMPKAVSLHPDFLDRIKPDPEITRETEEYKNEFHGVPFVVNPNLEADWLLIKPENL